jgi:hypothetical protein
MWWSSQGFINPIDNLQLMADFTRESCGFRFSVSAWPPRRFSLILGRLARKSSSHLKLTFSDSVECTTEKRRCESGAKAPKARVLEKHR